MFLQHKLQLNAEIQREKTMADTLMYIPNNDAQNYNFWRLLLKHLDTQLNEPTNQSC